MAVTVESMQRVYIHVVFILGYACMCTVHSIDLEYALGLGTGSLPSYFEDGMAAQLISLSPIKVSNFVLRKNFTASSTGQPFAVKLEHVSSESKTLLQIKLEEAIGHTGKYSIIIQGTCMHISLGLVVLCSVCIEYTVGGKLAVKLLQLQARWPAVGARKVREGIVSSEKGSQAPTFQCFGAPFLALWCPLPCPLVPPSPPFGAPFPALWCPLPRPLVPPSPPFGAPLPHPKTLPSQSVTATHLHLLSNTYYVMI